jgi:hypothetical protein
MHRHHLSGLALLIGSVATLLLASCAEQAEPPQAMVAKATVTNKPGTAGGVTEHTYFVDSVVTAVDEPGRTVTLKGAEGRQETFSISPGIKDLSELNVGDRVQATFVRREYVDVRRDDAPIAETYDTKWDYSDAGEKPHRLRSSDARKVGRVVAIDHTSRTADIEFADGVVNCVPIRSDVDLSKYNAGDNVIVRVTSTLTVISRSR